MILPTGDICHLCRCESTGYTEHRSGGAPFSLQNFRLVPCSPEHAALWEKAKSRAD